MINTQKPMLVFQTDFTYKEGAIMAMYGVVKSVDRELEIIDGTHELPQFDTWTASYRLYQSMGFWPKGTIFVSVVDPGVGTPRKACVALTNDGYYVVTPDNGALTHIINGVGVKEVREIDETVNRYAGTLRTSIFHGRDLFGYCAAKLASGLISFEEVGPKYDVSEIVAHEILTSTIEDGVVKGIFEIDDPNFGNLWTNIHLDDFDKAGFVYGDMLNVKITHKDTIVFNQNVLFHKSFGMVEKGEPIIYTNELIYVSLALSQGHFENVFGLGFGPDYKVEFSK